MGRRGPLPKSAELRSISGSERRKPKENPLGVPKSQLKSVTPLKALPPPPPLLKRSPRGTLEYNEVGPLLIEAGLLTRANLYLFVGGCRAIGQIVEAVEEGLPMNQSLLTLYKNILGEFGLTPTSQIRRGGPEAPPAEQGEPANEFEANKRNVA